MSNRSRIPQTIPAFNTYINTTNAYLPVVTPPSADPNWKRLGLTAQNQTDWSTKCTNWHDNLYPLYSNVNTRTKTVNDNVKSFMKNFRDFGSKLLNIMAASPNAITEDANVFNFVLERKKPTHPTEPIMELCYATIDAAGGGFKFSFRTSHDSKRASLAAGADSVQMAFKVGDPVPAGANDQGMETMLITRATFKHTVESSDSGKKAYIYVRWYNTKYPTLASSWSKLYTVVIP